MTEAGRTGTIDQAIDQAIDRWDVWTIHASTYVRTRVNGIVGRLDDHVDNDVNEDVDDHRIRAPPRTQIETSPSRTNPKAKEPCWIRAMSSVRVDHQDAYTFASTAGKRMMIMVMVRLRQESVGCNVAYNAEDATQRNTAR
mmetsp:Transcript_23605/g.65923  ORF Transcript_23605/g.65923 Transcript_23605/m.65923 type:complete len:141 (-) Transcript_23605:243-665(-)